MPAGWAAVRKNASTLELPALALRPSAVYIFALTATVVQAPAAHDAQDGAAAPLPVHLHFSASATVRVVVRERQWRPALSGCNRVVGADEAVEILVSAPPHSTVTGAGAATTAGMADADAAEADAAAANAAGALGWTYGWACVPWPCAVAGTALERQLALLGSGLNGWFNASALRFNASELVPPPSRPVDSGAISAPISAPVSLIFFALREAREEGLRAVPGAKSAVPGAGLGEVHAPRHHRLLARCELRVANGTALALAIARSEPFRTPAHVHHGYTLTNQSSLERRPERHNANEELRLSLVPATAREPLTALSWRSEAPTPIAPATGWARPVLAFPKFGLGAGGGSYAIWLTAVSETTGRAGGACWLGFVNAPPLGGTLTVRPLLGTALVTSFTLHASGWHDEPDDLPLTFSFEHTAVAALGTTLGGADATVAPNAANTSANASHAPETAPLETAPLADASSSSELVTKLPQPPAPATTLRIALTVCDAHGGCGAPVLSPLVQLRPARANWAEGAALSLDVLDDVDAALRLGDVGAALVMLGGVLTELLDAARDEPMLALLDPSVWLHTELLDAQVRDCRLMAR